MAVKRMRAVTMSLISIILLLNVTGFLLLGFVELCTAGKPCSAPQGTAGKLACVLNQLSERTDEDNLISLPFGDKILSSQKIQTEASCQECYVQSIPCPECGAAFLGHMRIGRPSHSLKPVNIVRQNE